MSEIAFNGSLKLVVSNAVTTPKPTKPTPTKSPDFHANTQTDDREDDRHHHARTETDNIAKYLFHFNL